MNNIQSTFSIKDLENLTGIKAHTIRIWEKRYNLLEPERTDTNIRSYDLKNFQKLLNVSYLNNKGYKISKIATIGPEEISELVKEISAKDASESHIQNAFKMSMINFDQQLFYETYKELEKEKSFVDIFYQNFIPLLEEIGLLWQTDTITTAHEHFITTLIRQKLLIDTERKQVRQNEQTNRTYVLYLPDNEVHELGLMFVNNQLIAAGCHCIFLGQSVPMKDLKDLLNYYTHITFISYFTVKPEKDEIATYLNDFQTSIINSETIELWLLGRMLAEIDKEQLPSSIKTFDSIKSLVKNI